MKFYRLFLLLALLVSFGAKAQLESTPGNSTDSLELRFGRTMYDTLPSLADSVFIALRTKKFESLLPFIATVAMIKEEYDTLDLEYLDRLAGVKATYMVNKLRKDHLKMMKIAKIQHLNIRNMELVKKRYRVRTHQEGHEYGEVIYLCKSGNHQFYISFVALKMLDHWFLADELHIEELLKPSGGGK